MRMRLVVVALACLLGLATAATAADVTLTSANLVANGWKTTTTAIDGTGAYVYGVGTNASVVDSTNYSANSMKFAVGGMPTAWKFQWAGISTNAFAGTTLASITSVRIKSLGFSGDSTNNWQPPTFTWIIQKDASNQRCVTWQPWSNGNARAPIAWNVYDAATTGRWFVEDTGVYYNSLAALKAALPNGTFATTANLPLSWGYASQNSFNVGFCPLYDTDRTWFGGTTGYVDWFEVGVNGNVTNYNLVPEPSSLLALCVGALGLVGTIRRKK